MAIPPSALMHGAAHAHHMAMEKRKKKEEERKKRQDNDSFFEAAYKGFEGDVQRLLQLRHVDVNGSSSNYTNSPTALYLAASAGHAEIVKLLLKRGAKVNWGNKFNTPLWIAARNDNTKVLQILIDQGGNINCEGENKMTPLIAAAFYNHMESVKLLIQNHASIDEHDDKGNTALHNAVIKGYEEIVRILIVQGEASLRKGDKNGNDALHLAVIHNRPAIVERLIKLEKASVENKTLEGSSSLDLAISSENSTILKILLEHSKIEINKLNELLKMAASIGNIETINILISFGANDFKSGFYTSVNKGHIKATELFISKLIFDKDNTQDHYLRGALCYASKNNDVNMVKFLLEKGANPLTESPSDSSPFRLAGLFGSIDVLDILFQNPKVFDAFKKENPDFLNYILRNSHSTKKSEMIKFLVNNGFNVDGKSTTFKSTPLQNAIIFMQNIEIIETLIECKADLLQRNQYNETPLNGLISNLRFKKTKEERERYLNIINLFIKYGANPNDHDRWGELLLVRAVLYSPETDIIGLLIEAGADVNKQSRNHGALSAAAITNRVEILKLLILAKANIDEIGKDGFTPLHWAAAEGSLECLKILIDAGANLSALDNNSFSPLYHACQNGQLRIIDFLKKYDKKFALQIHDYQKKEISHNEINEKLKKAAVEIILEHLEAYEKISKPRTFVKVNSTRESTIRELKNKLDEIKKDNSLKLLDILNAVKKAQDFIIEKKAYGLRGYKKSKLYIQLEEATISIKQACDVITSIITIK